MFSPHRHDNSFLIIGFVTHFLALFVDLGTRSRASVVACPHDAKRAGPASQERIPTKPTAHFERNEVTMICETAHQHRSRTIY
jgi:hypothetical protein